MHPRGKTEEKLPRATGDKEVTDTDWLSFPSTWISL